MYQLIGNGRKTDPLSVEQIATLLGLLSTKPNGGLSAAIDVLYMVIHCKSSKCVEYQIELQTYCTKFVGELNWASIDLKNENLVIHLEKIIEFALAGSEPHEAASKALNRLIQQERSGKGIFPGRLGNILLPFFKKCPMEALDAVYVRDTEERYSTALRMLNAPLDRHGDTAVSVVPEEALIDWCKISPDDRCTFAAQTCKLFERSNPDGLVDEHVISISSAAKRVLALAPQKKTVLEIYLGRLRPNSWSGSLAVIMRQRLNLLDQLNSTEDAELRMMIEETKGRFSKMITAEERRERTEELSRTASFE